MKDGKTVEGKVVAAVLVDKKGKVKKAELKKSIKDKKFDKAVLKAAEKLKFQPAVYNYEPIEHWYIISLEFDSEKVEYYSKSDD